MAGGTSGRMDEGSSSWSPSPQRHAARSARTSGCITPI